jgi:hypothetical protein
MPLTLPDPNTIDAAKLDQLKKPALKAIIESIYLDGIEDLTVDWGEGDTIATGRFIDKRPEGDRVFDYHLSIVDGAPNLDYTPVSGNFEESGDDAIEFDEVDFDEFISGHRQAIARNLESSLLLLGLDEFVESDRIVADAEWDAIADGMNTPEAIKATSEAIGNAADD